jgi:hypothetical protein
MFNGPLMGCNRENTCQFKGEFHGDVPKPGEQSQRSEQDDIIELAMGHGFNGDVKLPKGSMHFVSYYHNTYIYICI